MINTRLLAHVLAASSVFMSSVAIAQNQSQTNSKTPASAAKKPTKTDAGQVHSDGERIFAQNCSRCHNAPDGFPPSISGTVVRHMRVRASLSQHDEQELLRFFNP